MSAAGKSKQLIDKLETKLRDTADQKKHLSDIRRHLRSSGASIPMLTPEQETKIEQYWGRYGIKLSSTDWHRYYYAKTGLEDPRFVPSDVFHRIIRPQMNDMKLAVAWSDKAYTDWVVRDVKTVKSIVRSVNGRLLNEQFELIDRKTADTIMNGHEKLVIKPTMYTNTGKGVVLAEAPFDIEKIIERYGSFFVVQLPLRQHPDMAKLNESSVNTIRVDSFLFDTQAHAIPAFVKVGNPGEFTDNGGGHKRVFIGIRDGRFSSEAFDHDYRMFNSIPSGYDFAGKAVPFYEDICRTVERAHSHIAHFGLAFWDVSVDEKGEPVIVEMNLRYPDSYVPQIGAGPFFGDYTDDVLEYISKKA